MHPVQQVQLLCLWVDTQAHAKEAYCRLEEFPEGEGCFLVAWSLMSEGALQELPGGVLAC